MFDKHSLRKLLGENYPLLAILIGVTLISVVMGPYRNGDTRLEYAAASGVLNWGMPYAYSIGNIINEPPFGFYTEALFFKVFGLSVDNGVALITLFGLGCTVLVYKLGKDLYGKSTGLFAAALFALTPWELVLSRSFLIDTQCLFLSLFCLYVGILAIRRDSVQLAFISGVFFAVALLTKLYSAFILIPLLLFYLYYRPKKPKQILSQLAAFCLPALYSSFLWYQVILGKGLLYMVQHSDFNDLNVAGVVPTYSFVSNFLVNYGLGIFFMAATVFSLIIGLLNMYLGVTLNLKVPYTSAVKYDYQALPFFSLAAASLAGKGVSLLNSAKITTKIKKILLGSFGVAGLFLLGISIFASLYFVHQFSAYSFVTFQVEPDKLLGYSLHVLFPTSQDILMNVQYVGFAFVLSGLLWASRYFIIDSFKSMRRWIEAKNTH
jgi:4-amino-4-deoxy-L-arabinose transferase-like glycosyltransferase